MIWRVPVDALISPRTGMSKVGVTDDWDEGW